MQFPKMQSTVSNHKQMLLEWWMLMKGLKEAMVDQTEEKEVKDVTETEATMEIET